MIENDETVLLIYLSILMFILGGLFGGFIDCVSCDMIANLDNNYEGNCFDICVHELGFKSLISIIFNNILKVKCCHCPNKHKIQHLLVEIITATLFVLIFLKTRIIDFTFLERIILVSILIGLSLVDINCYIIPNEYIIVGVINWLIFSLIRMDWHLMLEGILSSFIISLSIYLLSIIMKNITKEESIGGGDIKLLFLICLYFDLLSSLFIVFLSSIIGIFFIIILKTKKIAFGPAISLAYLLFYLGGHLIDFKCLFEAL